MDVFMRNIGFGATKSQIKAAVAQVLHGPEFMHYSSVPLNLEVHIFPRKGKSPSRCGILTLPTVEVGDHFLREYGGNNPRKAIVIGIRIIFEKSKKGPRASTVGDILRLPYVDPTAEEARERRADQLRSRSVGIRTMQFGWECRDHVYSVEWEKTCSMTCIMQFDEERREFRIKYSDFLETRTIAIRAAQVKWTACGWESSHGAIVYLSLWHAPSYETEPDQSLLQHLADLSLTGSRRNMPLRQRHSSFDISHATVAAYTSLAIRLVCHGADDLKTFRWLCSMSYMKVDDFLYPIERRELFCPSVRSRYATWLAELPWPVAFQVEALTRYLYLDLTEALGLQGRIKTMIDLKGVTYTSAFLRHFAGEAKALFWYGEDPSSAISSVENLFSRCEREYVLPTPRHPQQGSEETFDCLHVTITPTTMHLEGPYPERSNRVIRSYPNNHNCFLRVNFVDETELQYRFDRDVDGRSFIQRRVGKILTEGLWIASRHFVFLAYSQSALKEHAVWFVKEFETPDGAVVNARSIIAGLGTFHNLPHDPRLIYCPARYGARISQAFTATDASVTIEVDEIFPLDDIKDPLDKWCFTDGVGTISQELARDIWKALRAKRRRARRAHVYSRAFQVRFMGSKGMLSVDYQLSGRAICLRPSMIKFEAPESREVEIAKAFDKPGRFYLNRPLIMLLEGLGVPYEVFREYQLAAVVNARKSVETLERSAKLMETYGLGASFRATSVMLSLHKLGVSPPIHDVFWQQMMDFAINHVLRELKHHARIPVDGAWNLVGVADVHGYLEEGEIFAHVAPIDGPSLYLEGLTMVTRSPTIHPGDVQVVKAIGRPPRGSPFEQESLRNCVVFSTKGARPLPSYLGGGDLDGDEYCCTMLESLRPRRTYPPASYEPAQKKMLNRPSTMRDVADFVTEYISSDSLGIIAINWLIIADQSEKGIFDEDCLTLSALHSDAVDYPKSGQPVPLDKIPRLKFRAKPDWNAPETMIGKNADYYESKRAIGRLYRDIDLPALHTVQRAQRSQDRQLQDQGEHERVTIDDVIAMFYDDGPYEIDEITMAVQERVEGFIIVGRHDEGLIAEIWEMFGNFISHLRTICADHTLSRTRSAMLTEEEAVVGTIVAKCSQPRKRKDLMSKLRERTAILVNDVRSELSGEEGTLPHRSMERAWVAYRIAVMQQDSFGAKSFSYVALGEIFDSIKIIEESERFF